MDDKSIFIRLLKFGEERGLQATTLIDFKEWALSQQDIESETCGQYQRAKLLFLNCFTITMQSVVADDEYILNAEYYFRLVEFQELEESRKASSDANKHSKIAIGFSIAAIFVGLVIGIIQLKSEIKLSPEQVSVMATKDLPVTQQVESEQLTQVIEALKQSNINTAELARLIEKQNKKGVE